MLTGCKKELACIGKGLLPKTFSFLISHFLFLIFPSNKHLYRSINISEYPG